MKPLSERYIEKYRDKEVFHAGKEYETTFNFIDLLFLPDYRRIVELEAMIEADEASLVVLILSDLDKRVLQASVLGNKKELNQLENKHFPKEDEKE